MDWIYIFIAAVVEVFWVIGLRYSDNWWEWTITVLLISFSIFLVIKACRSIPSGTVYAVFTGLGASALVVVDIYWFNQHFSAIELSFIVLVIVGVVGLKLTSAK